MVTLEGEPWFDARCVHAVLGMTGYPSNYLQKLDSDEKQVLARTSRDNFTSALFEGTPAPKVTIISESDLYKLVMRSDKLQAKAFQGWVTREVLI